MGLAEGNLRSMTYQRFEDLPVWQQARRLNEVLIPLSRNRAFATSGDLRDQLQRAALSVMNNIAEGFERGSTNELLQFLYIARGSAGEVRSMLLLREGLPEFGHLKSQISDLKSMAESCSRQLRAWADQLQNSAVRGQRHLTDADRQRQRAEAFLTSLKQRFPAAGR